MTFVFIISALLFLGVMTFGISGGGPGFMVHCPRCNAKYEANSGKHLCRLCQQWFRVSRYGECVEAIL